MEKKKEPFVFTRGSVILIVTLLLLAITVPSVVFFYEMYGIRKEQNMLLSSLKDNVREDVMTYMNQSSVLAGGTGSGIISSGYVIKGEDETSQEIAEEVANILDEAYVSRIESDMLEQLYARIESIVAEKMANVTVEDDSTTDRQLSEDELDQIYEHVNDIVDKKVAGITASDSSKEDKQTDTTSRQLTDAEIKQVSDAVSAIITKDLQNYKQETLNSMTELDNFYSSVQDKLGNSEVQKAALEGDMNVLTVVYDSKFSSLEATDRSLQTQITAIKAQNNNLQNQYNTLSQKILANSSSQDLSKVQSELTRRVETLKTSSDTKDTELANLLIKTQTDLNKTIGTEDAKIYDNSVRIIQLTDALTNLNQNLTGAIDNLSNHSDNDVTALSQQLKALEASLSLTDSTMANVSEEMAAEEKARIADIAELKALIEQYQTSAGGDNSQLLTQINNKSTELSLALGNTAATLQNEYTRLIKELSAEVDNNSLEIAQALENTKKELEKSISETDVKLSTSIEETNTNLANTNESLRGSINETNTNLANTNTFVREALAETNTNLANTDTSLRESIAETQGSLNLVIETNKSALEKSITDSNDELRSYVDTTNVATQEQLLTVISSLQDEIDDLQSQLNTLEEQKNAQVVALQNAITDLRTEKDRDIAALRAEKNRDIAALRAEKDREIAALKAEKDAEVQDLESRKLNIVDSTNYDYNSSTNTVNVNVPATNPNFTTSTTTTTSP